MGTGWRALRRRILTPDVSETQLDKRGFHKKSPAAQELLESIGRYFLTGYGHAVEARTPGQAAEWLDHIPPRFRGFAYEGAGMGYAMLDGLPGGGSDHVLSFLNGEADHQDYILYVGAGWAMGRLPRFRWPSPGSFDPLLRWLVLDGYGFHQAYFRTRRYVHEQYQDPAFPWPGGQYTSYANRAIDQGIGRAMWFIGGTDVELVTSMIAEFPERRRGDLYAGVGLASTYACGVTTDELRLLAERAGEYHGQLAQGSAFAAESRIRGRVAGPETDVATRAICGLSAVDAARITQDIRPTDVVDGVVPAFESWRRRIAELVLITGGVGS